MPEIPTKLRFAYILYYYLCDMLPKINAKHDETFMQFLQEVLTTYGAALECNSEYVMQIFCDSLFDFSQKENMMWTVRENVKQVNSEFKAEIITGLIRAVDEIADSISILDAHLTVSKLLGHERADVTNIYLVSLKDTL